MNNKHEDSIRVTASFIIQSLSRVLDKVDRCENETLHHSMEELKVQVGDLDHEIKCFLSQTG